MRPSAQGRLLGRPRNVYPGEAPIRIKGQPGRAIGDQIRSLDKIRLQSRIGSLTADEMAAVDEALLVTLGLIR